MVQVIKKGLETSVQDYPGRIGTLNQGFPSSGPMDSWSFRLANILVENESGAAALECQFMGPTLKFDSDRIIAITGADMRPKIDGKLVPIWESLAVKKDQILEMSYATIGARAYIAFSGGINTTPWLGSRSTFHKAGVGGIDGKAIQDGQIIPLNKSIKANVLDIGSNQGFFTVQQTCPQCSGYGEMIGDPCNKCSGNGKVQANENVTVKIPKGVDDGTRIRVSGNHVSRGKHLTHSESFSFFSLSSSKIFLPDFCSTQFKKFCFMCFGTNFSITGIRINSISQDEVRKSTQ